ncbi:unnamed protein product [Phytophthora lilii]|uniref:Unnamed protein product n=1 Tax=Phytophthora lilii TaxID=2077276 RepID=A0A9W6TD64_9STRA|nr:unnamed protein product [Phytophthora lilii]
MKKHDSSNGIGAPSDSDGADQSQEPGSASRLAVWRLLPDPPVGQRLLNLRSWLQQVVQGAGCVNFG